MTAARALLIVWAAGTTCLLAGWWRAARRARARADLQQHLDEAIAVAMGRHPAGRGPEDDPHRMHAIAARARQLGGGR